MINGRPLICVITGRATENVQKMMIEGIMSQADRFGIYTSVLTNIYNYYNFQEYSGYLEAENKIYELMHSSVFDGIIVMAETLSAEYLRPLIIEHLKKCTVPVVIAGDRIEGFPSIDNDITDDFRDITRHLTDVHGFTDIDIITGKQQIQTSADRVNGVKEVMAEKNLPFGDDNIIYGDFWFTGGEAAADDYISGKRRLPQAVICANDYMAYGLIDKLFKNDINVPEQLTVIGYEYVGERLIHFPILSTYLRNREAIGRKAVNLLHEIMTGEKTEEISTRGCIVCGDSCTCAKQKKFLISELHEIQTEQLYNTMAISGNFAQKLAGCHSLNDYINTLASNAYLIRDLNGLYLCLYESWTEMKNRSDLGTSSNDEMMAMYTISSPVPVPSSAQYFKRKMLFPDNLPGAGDKFFLYFVPLVTNGTEIGYLILQYEKPDGCDKLMISWLNSAVNALDVLRMKNDINHLLEYNNLSAFHDTLTGFYNKEGLIYELNRLIRNAEKNDKISIVLIKTNIGPEEIHLNEKSSAAKLDIDVSECMKKLASLSHAICAKISVSFFAYAVTGAVSDGYDETISDRLKVLISHSPVFKNEKGIDNIITSGVTVSAAGKSAEEILKSLNENILRKIDIISNIRKMSGFNEFNSVRVSMYRYPEQKWNAETECRDFHLSCGHFRAAYKNMFGISFHRDLIQSRMLLAKYLLMTTSLSLPAIAAKCGYEDDKYFLRQFRQQEGISPNAYRKIEVL